MTETGSVHRHIVSRFVQAGATTPARPIAFDVEDADTRRVLHRLRRHGAVAEVAPGRYWLDPDRLGRFRTGVRRRVAAGIAASGLALAATAVLAVAE